MLQANNQQDQLKLAVENILKVGEETPNHSTLNVDSTETPGEYPVFVFVFFSQCFQHV